MVPTLIPTYSSASQLFLTTSTKITAFPSHGNKGKGWRCFLFLFQWHCTENVLLTKTWQKARLCALSITFLQEACCAAAHLGAVAWPNLLPAFLLDRSPRSPPKWDHTFTFTKLQRSTIWLELLPKKAASSSVYCFSQKWSRHLPGVPAKQGTPQLWFPGFIFFQWTH